MFSEWQEDNILYLPHITKIMISLIGIIYTIIRIIWLPFLKGFNFKNLNLIDFAYFIYINIIIDTIKLTAFIVNSLRNILKLNTY